MSDAPTLTLLVETATGTYRRTVRPATVLPTDREIGGAAEDATRGAAAAWGMPDFVFRSALRGRGSGRREIGDALLVVGPLGAAVQIKARQAPAIDPHRERSWLDKKIGQALRQAAGTIRALRRADQVILSSERGNDVAIRAAGVDWVRIVVLEHPGVDDYRPEGGAVVLLRRDWEFLFDQLRSTYAVIEYLHRVSGDDPIPLGLEPLRYYELAAADAATAPSELDKRLEALVTNRLSGPLLPQQPIGRGDDRFHIVFRAVLEDIALSRPPPDSEYWDMLEILAALDAMPVGYRAELGRTLVDWLDEVATVRKPAIMWRFRVHSWPDRPLLLFAAASRHEPLVQTAFSAWVSLRHQEFIELIPERSDIITVGVLLTPRRDGSRPWDITMVSTRGDQEITPEDRALFESTWGKLGERRPPE